MVTLYRGADLAFRLGLRLRLFTLGDLERRLGGGDRERLRVGGVLCLSRLSSRLSL